MRHRYIFEHKKASCVLLFHDDFFCLCETLWEYLYKVIIPTLAMDSGGTMIKTPGMGNSLKGLLYSLLFISIDLIMGE